MPLSGALDPAGCYRFDPEVGAMPIAAATPDAVSGAALLALRAQWFDDPQHRRDIRRILRRAIDRRLDGRRLRSREWLRALRR